MERFREVVPVYVRDFLAVGVIGAGGSFVVIKVATSLLTCISRWRFNQRWKNSTKDVIIVHRIPAARTCPNASPFVLKLETYLRMANIPYEIDVIDGMGPKGKTPWITLNGVHTSDSQLCIEMLSKKFDKRIGNYSDEERAVSTMARIMMDEHFYWGLLMWRYVHSLSKGYGPNTVYDLVKVLGFPRLMSPFIESLLKKKVGQAAWFQGMGRHSEKDIVKMASDDLRALSNILGDKKFILGNEPCEDDCAIFGELAQALYCMPGSPYEKLLNGELSNLKQYCLRIKELYWSDWDNCI